MIRFLYTALLLGVVSSAFAYHPDTGREWELMVEFPVYGALEHPGGASLGEYIYIAGGHGQKEGWRNDVWRTSDGIAWTQLTTDAPWPGRSQHAMHVHDDRLWIMGGTGWALYNDVWSSPDGIEWTAATENAAWTPRSDFGSAVHDSRLWVMGGHSDGLRTNDVWASSDGADWELVTDNAAWRTRSHFAAVAHDGRLYVMGGAFFHEPNDRYFYLNDVWSSADGRDWTMVTESADWSQRQLHRVVSFGGEIWLVGGDDRWWGSELLRDVWHSPDGLNWTVAPRPSRDGRMINRNAFALVAHDDALHVIGGYSYIGGAFWPIPFQYRTPPRSRK